MCVCDMCVVHVCVVCVSVCVCVICVWCTCVWYTCDMCVCVCMSLCVCVQCVYTSVWMKDQDAWPPLPLAIYVNTIKDRNGKGLTEAEEMRHKEPGKCASCNVP